MALLRARIKSPFTVAPTKDGGPCSVTASVLRISINALKKAEERKEAVMESLVPG